MENRNLWSRLNPEQQSKVTSETLRGQLKACKYMTELNIMYYMDLQIALGLKNINEIIKIF